MKTPHPTKAEQGAPSNGVNPTTSIALTPARGSAITMSSREIADLTGKRHDNVVADIRKMLEELGLDALKFQGIYLDSMNRQQVELHLTRELTDTLLTGYSAKLRLVVVRRWHELEAQAAPAIPQTMAQALRFAAEQAEQLEQQQAQLALAAPKVEFVDRYVAAPSGAMGFRQVCKLLGANEARFRDFLVQEKIMYYLAGELMPHAQHYPRTGRFVVKTGSADSGHKYRLAKFTSEGVTWIAGLWQQECQRLAETGGVYPMVQKRVA